MSATENCPFCRPSEPLLRDDLAFAIYDRSPVTPGHMLIIPYRHVDDWFDTTPQEKSAMLALLERSRAHLRRERNPEGFNFGVNCGAVAGQSIFHVHMHLIPRYRGDMDDPLGGVRGVIPARQKY